MSGKVSIKPLTVLVGPSNSGKSYVALMVHSILNPAVRPPAPPPRIEKLVCGLLGKELPLVLEKRAALDVSKHLASEIVGEAYERIGRFFSRDLGSLVRTGAKKCTLKIRTAYFSASMALPDDRRRRILPSDFRVEFASRAGKTVPGTVTATVAHPGDCGDAPRRRSAPSEPSVAGTLWSLRSQMQPLASFYLPASRSGVLRGHRALSGSIVRHSPRAGLREVEAPNLSGAVSDFVADVLEIPERPSGRLPFHDIASAMEREILGGRVELARGIPPQIKFYSGKRAFPLDLASSAVSGAGPLALYLKRVITEPGLLIIEEPEAHLHPREQAAMAGFLARLVRRGMKVMITTHSPFITEALSNLVQIGAALPAGRVPGYLEKDFLVPEEVGAYSFKPVPSGYAIRELRVSKEDGLSSEEFVAVTARLYEDFLTIRDCVDGAR